MQRVKRIGTFYTLENKASVDKLDLLCDQCGNAECSVRMVLQRLKINRFNAKIAVKRCESFIPVLEFLDHSGMDAKFNTFRLGGAWFDRVVEGQLVNLTNTKKKWSATAEVTAVDRGPFHEMNKLYGADNHLAIEAGLNGEDFDLQEVMRSIYGDHRFNPNSMCTVISMRRFDGVRA